MISSLGLLHFLQAFSWASVTSKNLPPSGTVSSSGIPPHVKAPVSQVTNL
jgi:Ras GTPase-activating protein-binding protein 1